MAATAVGAKAISIANGTAQNCATISSLAGKGISFGLGLGLGTIIPFALVAGGFFITSMLIYTYMNDEIIMNPD